MATEIQVPAPGRQDGVEPQASAAPLVVTRVEPATHNYRAVQVVWMVTSLVTTLVAIRFVLRLLGASVQSGFVSLIYGLTDALVSPFRAIFPAASGQSSTLDVASLVAIVVYALVGLGLASVVKLMTTPRGARSAS
jgi:uncharacterized protein YggT (Ycf19 family)